MLPALTRICFLVCEKEREREGKQVCVVFLFIIFNKYNNLFLLLVEKKTRKIETQFYNSMSSISHHNFFFLSFIF